MNMKKNGSAAILYYYPCPDGAFAALAPYLCFKPTSLSPLLFPNTVYRPLRAQDLPLHKISDLYLLHFVGPSGFVQEVSSHVQKVIILVHHKTALEMLCNETLVGENTYKVIDMERFGVTIAFDYFKEKLLSPDVDAGVNHQPVLDESEHVLQLFRHIEDGELETFGGSGDSTTAKLLAVV